MAAKNLLVKEVEDITECPICTEVLCNPKILPCFHTFCLKCIEQYCKDNDEGDAMPCPMCRKEFIVPDKGLSKLSVNFFIERLIAVQSASGMNEVENCRDVCLDEEHGKVEASFFCKECQENIHRSMKMTMTWHPSAIGDHSAIGENKNEIQRAVCDKHRRKEIQFFCKDCRKPFCATCLIAEHKKHDFCEIEDMVEEFRNIFNDVEGLMKNIKDQSDEVDKQLGSFLICTDNAGKNILERREAIKRMADVRAQALLIKLSSHKTHVLKKFHITKEELQRNMIRCENVARYCQKAIAVKSIPNADVLRTSVEELKQMPVPELNIFPDIQLVASNLDVTTNLRNIFENIQGNLKVKHSLDFNPQGIAILSDELFMIIPNSPHINVYNIEPFAFQRTITVEGMSCPCDIVARENVLYVNELCDQKIHRIQLPEETVSTWKVDGIVLKLSITKNDNVIIASRNSEKILEYTSGGMLVREIRVGLSDDNFVGLQHVIQLDGDKFLICHATTNRVCIIDNTGRMIKCYGGSKESGKGKLIWPVHLAINRNGSILVADYDNNRIVQLNASLEYMNESVGFKQPIRLLLNEELGRLYVLEWNDRSVTIIDA